MIGAAKMMNVATFHGTDDQTFNSSTTWSKPVGFPSSAEVTIEVWGGGGSGNAGTGHGGGGGGGY